MRKVGIHKPYFRRICERCLLLYVPTSKFSRQCPQCIKESMDRAKAKSLQKKREGILKDRPRTILSLPDEEKAKIKALIAENKNVTRTRVCKHCNDIYKTERKKSLVCPSCTIKRRHLGFIKRKKTFDAKIIKSPTAFRQYAEALNLKIAKRKKNGSL